MCILFKIATKTKEKKTFIKYIPSVLNLFCSAYTIITRSYTDWILD